MNFDTTEDEDDDSEQVCSDKFAHSPYRKFKSMKLPKKSRKV